MKKSTLSLLIALSFFNSVLCQAQKNEPNQSNAEIFSSKSGTLIEKQFVEIGTVKSIVLKIAKFTDMISGESVKALRLSTTNNKISSLDKDEVDALIKSLTIIQNKILNTKPENYTEVSFISREGFEAGCYYKDFTKRWILYCKIDKYSVDSIVWMKEDNLPKLLELLELAKKELI